MSSQLATVESDKAELNLILGTEIALDFISNFEEVCLLFGGKTEADGLAQWCLGFEATTATWSTLEPYLCPLKQILIAYKNDDDWEQVDPHIFVAHPAGIAELLNVGRNVVAGRVEAVLKTKYPRLALISHVPSFGCCHFYLTVGDNRDVILCHSSLKEFIDIWVCWMEYRRKELDSARSNYALLKRPHGEQFEADSERQYLRLSR